jgi:alginate O-acetyltransferase complex protein AlgI
MLFSSLLFIYGFLPVFLVLYYLSSASWRNTTALVGSLLFYAWGEPVFAGLLLVSGTADYALSLWMANLPPAARRRRALLALALTYNLGALAYCKYSNFFVEQFNRILGGFQVGGLSWTQVILPIGISFFTFQKITYLVDVYRGTARPTRSLRDYLLYISLFPHLVAGPIIRFHDLADQITGREHTLDRFTSGLWRFALGLGRKVLFANPLGLVADQAFTTKLAALGAAHAWLGILCYTLQIYCDFAAYSDMAVGLARMFGFEFCENFRHPYSSLSVTEFWRRWHCSLSNFMRDYLYIPLGGNRVAAWRRVVNLWLVFLASGFWHGASWNFIVWGGYHGFLLSLEKMIGHERLRRIPALAGWAATFLLAMLGWVFFRANNLSEAIHYMERLFGVGATPVTSAALGSLLTRRTWAVLAIVLATSFLPENWWDRLGWTSAHPRSRSHALARVGVGATLFLLACAALVNQSYNPFIYFRF